MRRMVWKAGDVSYEQMCDYEKYPDDRSEFDESESDDESLPSLIDQTPAVGGTLSNSGDDEDDAAYFFV